MRQRTGALQRSLTDRREAEEQLNRTLDNLRQAMGATLTTLALAVETKDPCTAGHQKRVADLARTIAMEMGLSEETIEGIRMAAIIHDIGKISLPAEILNKPGKLSEAEFQLIKTHPQTGYDILKEVEFPWPVARIVWQHHERLDGSGYPLGLKGEEILPEARVLAVADVVEAMCLAPLLPADAGAGEGAGGDRGAAGDSLRPRRRRCLPAHLPGKGFPSGIDSETDPRGEDDMLIRCWGARGSIPVSGREYLRYGGDTPCVEIRTGG